MAIESLLLAFRYPAIFAGSLIEGPTVMIITGFFLRLGYFHFLSAYLLLVAGDLLGDFIWYEIGRLGLHRTVYKIGKFFNVSEKNIETLKFKFRRHEGKILFGSKLTAGFGFAVPIMIVAGMSRVPLKKFGLYTFLGGLIWAGSLMSIGFFFGNVYLRVEEGFRIVFLVALAAAILLFSFGFSRYTRNTFLKNKF
ncbi:MAG: DedA family protein [Parcubacteria group bacterium]|jgi:membrane protein DedA with SNARE-associated domain